MVTSVGGFSGEHVSPKRPTGTRTLTPGRCTAGTSCGSRRNAKGAMSCRSRARLTKICSEWTVLPVSAGTSSWTMPLPAVVQCRPPGRIRLRVPIESRLSIPVSEPFDVAIRMGPSEDSQLIARPLASLAPHLYASPGYLDRSGEPRKPADLERHECLSILKAGSWTLQDGKRTATVSVGGRFTLNSVGMIRRLAVLDLGIVLMPEEIVADELASGKLRRILPGWHGTPMPVYAIIETRLLPAKTQRFIEFLRARLAR